MTIEKSRVAPELWDISIPRRLCKGRSAYHNLEVAALSAPVVHGKERDFLARFEGVDDLYKAVDAVDGLTLDLQDDIPRFESGRAQRAFTIHRGDSHSLLRFQTELLGLLRSDR